MQAIGLGGLDFTNTEYHLKTSVVNISIDYCTSQEHCTHALAMKLAHAGLHKKRRTACTSIYDW